MDRAIVIGADGPQQILPTNFLARRLIPPQSPGGLRYVIMGDPAITDSLDGPEPVSEAAAVLRSLHTRPVRGDLQWPGPYSIHRMGILADTFDISPKTSGLLRSSSQCITTFASNAHVMNRIASSGSGKSTPIRCAVERRVLCEYYRLDAGSQPRNLI